jgi:hypothetical protein
VQMAVDGQFAGRRTMSMLGRALQFVAVVLALVVSASPLSACLASAAQMSAERECCRKMVGLCNTAVMPSSHSCCQVPVSQSVLTASKVQRNDFISPAALLSGVGYPFPVPATWSSVGTAESPPGSPPQVNNILRI